MPYPYYTNPYSNAYPISYGGSIYNAMTQPVMQQTPNIQQPQYMINVDGENSAKSWQPQMAPQPNTIIPLFDSDGQHVYFKTYDAYGRMNPIRKGRIVFDDEINASESSQDSMIQDMSGYATKEDFDGIKKELESIKDMLAGSQSKTNQNGSTKSR